MAQTQTHGGDGGGGAPPKRQRRPNVRLADPGAGDLVYYDPFRPRQQRRSTKKQKVNEKPPSDVNKNVEDEDDEEEEDELDGVAIGMWRARVSKPKSRKVESNGNRKRLSIELIDEKAKSRKMESNGNGKRLGCELVDEKAKSRKIENNGNRKNVGSKLGDEKSKSGKRESNGNGRNVGDKLGDGNRGESGNEGVGRNLEPIEEEAEEEGEENDDEKLKSRKMESNGDRKNVGAKLGGENRDESGNDEVGRNFEPIGEEEGEENDNDSSLVRSMDDDSENDEDGDVNGDNGVEKGRGKELRFQVSDEMDDGSYLSGKDGVKVWLKKLGLERYAPVFEIHEVDDEVLPLLTLEDLKDMGITAVGSRRKMFCSIQNLGKEFC